MIKISASVDLGPLKDFAGEFEKRAAEEVRRATLAVEAGAKTRAPVDTGFLRSSIQSEMKEPLDGEVTVGAEYAIYQELGTRSMAAQPFLTPAAEEVEPVFHKRIQAAADDAARKAGWE